MTLFEWFLSVCLLGSPFVWRAMYEPPQVTCTHDETVTRDSIALEMVPSFGNQPYQIIELRDAETQTVCRTQ